MKPELKCVVDNTVKTWGKNGLLHREDGPAVIKGSGENRIEEGKNKAAQNAAQDGDCKAGHQVACDPEGQGIDKEADGEHGNPAQRARDQKDGWTDQQVDN